MSSALARALLFDLDDTLIPEANATRAAFLAAANALCGPELDPDVLAERARVHGRVLWQDNPVRAWTLEVGVSSGEALCGPFDAESAHEQDLEAWCRGFRPRAWAAALAEQDCSDARLAARLAQRFSTEREARYQPFSGVTAMLKELRRHWRLGILTNGAPSLQRRKIDKADLAEQVDEILVSGDLGVGKPSPKPFRVLLERLDVEASRAVMVGNSVEADMAGARATGLRAVHLRLAGQPGAGHLADATVSAPSELPGVLAELEQLRP